MYAYLLFYLENNVLDNEHRHAYANPMTVRIVEREFELRRGSNFEKEEQ